MGNAKKKARVNGLKRLRKQIPFLLKRVIRFVGPNTEDKTRIQHAMASILEAVSSTLERLSLELGVQAAPSIWMENFAAKGCKPTKMVLPRCQSCSGEQTMPGCIYYRWTPPLGFCYMKKIFGDDNDAKSLQELETEES